MTHHVVMFSGGVGSYATARRVRETRWQPGDRLTLLFADVKGESLDPHIGEDEDCYRFIDDAAAIIPDAGLVMVSDGRDIWQVFKDRKFLGNSRIANCSQELKQKPARAWLEANTDPADTIVYVGIDWTETHRVPAVVAAYQPWRAEAPMTEAPWIDKDEMIEQCRADGIEPPRMYAAGFPHANCGGGCVRAGQGQFRLLLLANPERFRVWERKEQELRDHLGKPVSILRDRRGGTLRPLPLTELRRRIEGAPETVDADDIGGCGCFIDTPELSASTTPPHGPGEKS